MANVFTCAVAHTCCVMRAKWRMYSLAHLLCDEGKVGNVQLVQGDDGVTPILAQWGATTKSGGATAKSGGATIVAPPSPHPYASE